MSSTLSLRSDILALIDVLSKAPQDFGLNANYAQASTSALTPSTSSSSGMTAASDDGSSLEMRSKLEPWEDDVSAICSQAYR
jgi:hypothetical protein